MKLTKQEIADRPSQFVILVVDDNVMNIKIIRMILEKNDYIVETTSNGKSAVDMITDNHSKYNLILMDLLMPNMTGLEATKLIRAYERKAGLAPIPIIATSGTKTPDLL
jgi:CheY-like chemotaxis protein